MIDALRTTLSSLGRLLLQWRGTEHVAGRWEGSQLKTRADAEAHTHLAAALLPTGIPVISEEDAVSHVAARPARYWLVDPIDGTASYAGGWSGFVTQAALMENERPVLAAVHAPALDLMFVAHERGGAYLNGAPLHLSQAACLATLIDNYPEPRGVAARVYAGLGMTSYVESGSLGLKVCRIADGTADLFVKDVTVRDWDIAPAHLILAEAGGSLCLPNGMPFRYSGPFDKPGVIAAGSAETAGTVCEWLRQGTAKAI